MEVVRSLNFIKKIQPIKIKPTPGIETLNLSFIMASMHQQELMNWKKLLKLIHLQRQNSGSDGKVMEEENGITTFNGIIFTSRVKFGYIKCYMLYIVNIKDPVVF